ncbi:MAG: type II secretion system protein [Armatimonadota bacterium]|nr:MAG: type II secretion system protein [Armatimonadota bacterium]
MRKLNEESGQALILAVLVMLIVAVLAALFLAVIASQLRQAQRQSFVIALQEIAEAGLRYADHNLVSGPEGADWRPDPNPGTFDYGEGEFRLTVTYEPEAGDPYSRFIKLESLAQLKGNPFLQRRMVAYKPILITDYVRFVTNGEKNPLPALLGAAVRMYLYENPPEIYPAHRYKTVLDGAIRVNADLTWHGDVQVNLSSSRGDSIAVAGDISHDVAARWNKDTLEWDGDPTEVLVSIDGGVPRVVLPSEDPAFTALGSYYRDWRQQTDAAGDPRWVRYLDPPALNPERYLALARDSGVWTDGQDIYLGEQVNSGWFGWGKGIYVDNPGHILYEHDYEQMRTEWTTPDPLLYPNWNTATSYTPDLVRITFHPVSAGGLGVPAVQLTWTSTDDPWEVWRYPNGSPTGVQDLYLPYPQNGVIYAAGDVAVSGTLPPAVGSPDAYYDQLPYDIDNLAAAVDSNRFYHVTVVSGGNIFVNGSLLSPVTAQVLDPDTAAATQAGSDSKIALLARDSVVFNTTALIETQATASVGPEGTAYHEIRPGEPLDCTVTTASFDPVQIYLKHTGQPGSPVTGHPGAAIMQVLINGVAYDWNLADPPGVYDDGTLAYSTKYWLFLPPPLAAYNNETNAIYPSWESIPSLDPVSGTDKRITFAPTAIGEPHVVRLQVTPDTSRYYWVRDIRARVDVEIDAAMFAEHGSWFVIPGTFLNPPPPDPTSDPLGDPAPGEPLDVRITVRGAISENRTAPVGDVMDWTAKWRGSNESWLPTSPNYDPDLGISQFTLRYLYDPSLRGALVPGEPGGPPRLPKLPVSPAMIAWGERI